MIWVSEIPDKVFTRLKGNFSKALKTEYKMTNSNFSSSAFSDTPSVFPFVCLKLLQPSEVGQDLEGTCINGALFTFQVDVTDNSSETTAKIVSDEVLRIMKKYGFDAVGMPYSDTSTKGTFRIVSRYRRTIGANDTL